jgi:hypothetical protein
MDGRRKKEEGRRKSEEGKLELSSLKKQLASRVSAIKNVLTAFAVAVQRSPQKSAVRSTIAILPVPACIIPLCQN